MWAEKCKLYFKSENCLYTKSGEEKRFEILLLAVRVDLKRFSTSEQYLRYDMLKGKREYLKKKISQKSIWINCKLMRKSAGATMFKMVMNTGLLAAKPGWMNWASYHYLGKQNCE